MADKKISQLTNITGANLADTDEFVVVDSSADETKAITWSELKEGLDTGTGFVRITGDTMTGDLSFGDNDKAIFGAGSDLQIYHDGSNSFIKDLGTGSLYLEGQNHVYIRGAGDGSTLARFSQGAQSELYHAGTKTLNTTSTGIDVTGTVIADSANITGTVTADGLTVDGDITSTGGDLNLATLDLNAIAATKAVTAVDVFVYDTSKDSDGGAWRKRTQGTSWYNETLNTATRGSRREFPAVAVIVAEAAKVTIYDGDDPALPMWMVFDGGSVVDLFTENAGNPHSSVYTLNGSLCVGNSSAYGLGVCNFIADTGFRFRNNTADTYSGYYLGPISARNDALGWDGTDPFGVIINDTINDVAMTVLPSAPIDAATGLPVPTIAVATDGGVSVIKDDGTVVDITNSNATYTFSDNVSVNEYGAFTISLGADNTNRWVYVFDAIPPVDTVISYNNKTATGLAPVSFYTDTTNFNSDFRVVANTSFAANETKALLGDGRGTTLGLARFVVDKTAPTSALHSFTTSSYNTGWMNGDIKGAFLSDTDDTDLVGGNLVTNGTFDTDTDWTKGIDWTISGGIATHTVGTGSDLNQANVLTIGNRYLISFDVTAVTDFGAIYVYSNLGYEVIAGAASVGSYTYEFTAGTTDLRFRGASTFGGSVDNISVKLADADRSVNANGLIVNGTVTRSPVATGADLVAYSGFSASNYLEQPYNSDLDFGTGDFCVMGWVNIPAAGSGQKIFFHRCDSALASGLIEVRKLSGDTIRVYVGNAGYSGSSLLETTAALPTSWSFVSFVRRSGILAVSINGGNEQTAAGANNVSNTSAAVSFGVRYSDGVLPFDNADGSLALWRISATAPTAEQIKKIYNDEKVLFQENAQATLYGSSDAVTALAHDDATNLLHVGTSAGRSVFQGLRRVDNTTTAVGNAISASNGLVVEE